MTTNTATSVQLEILDHIAFITFVRPNEANTVDRSFGANFARPAFAVEAASDVRAVVMTGQGRHFCLGGDLKGMVASGGGTQAYLSELTMDLHAGMVLLAQLDAPVIAAVNGTAAGAGLGLVLAADLAIAATTSKFVSAYTGVALTPDAGCTFYLPRLVGHKRAMELFLTNRVLDADQALAWGIVNRIVAAEKVVESARELADIIASGPTGAFGALKRLMAESDPGLEAQINRESRSIAARGASREGREGIAAFLGKRPANYR